MNVLTFLTITVNACTLVGELRVSMPAFVTTDLTVGRLKGAEELQGVFKSAGVDLQKPLVTSCGTGVTASVLALALAQLDPPSKVCHSMLVWRWLQYLDQAPAMEALTMCVSRFAHTRR